jgi:hypothetical protein
VRVVDPDETLSRIRECVADGGPSAQSELIELVAALDEWLSGGGFIPDGWATAEPRVPHAGLGEHVDGDCAFCSRDDVYGHRHEDDR